MLQDYALSIDEIRKARRDNYAVTAACLIGDELTLKIPPFHFNIYGELLRLAKQATALPVGHTQKAFTVPREHNKTTLVKLAITTIFRETSLSFLLYTSNTQTMALNAIRDIVSWFTKESETEIWGKSEVLKKNESDGLWIVKIPLEDGMKKTIILKAAGTGQQVRGLIIDNKRPDLFVYDDIEDLNTADSGVQQQKLDEWFFGTAQKAGAKRTLRIMIGNIIRKTTLLARLCQNPDWHPTNYGCLIKNRETGKLEPLWPGRHTVESLLADYREHRKLGVGHVWESEMMNLSRDLTLADSISNECLIPSFEPDAIRCGFICVDPAFGVKKLNDESAITVHVNAYNAPTPVLCDHDKGRWKEEMLFDRILEKALYWGLNTIAIEAVAAQRLLIPLFRSFMLIRGMDPETLSFLPFAGANTLDAKASRIKAFRSSLQTGSYLLADSQIDVKLALEEWSPETAEHDDLPDSAALGQLCWEQNGKFIKESGTRISELGALLYREEAFEQEVERIPFHLATM